MRESRRANGRAGGSAGRPEVATACRPPARPPAVAQPPPRELCEQSNLPAGSREAAGHAWGKGRKRGVGRGLFSPLARAQRGTAGEAGKGSGQPFPGSDGDSPYLRTPPFLTPGGRRAPAEQHGGRARGAGSLSAALPPPLSRSSEKPFPPTPPPPTASLSSFGAYIHIIFF